MGLIPVLESPLGQALETVAKFGYMFPGGLSLGVSSLGFDLGREAASTISLPVYGASDWTRTSDITRGRDMLYPAELRKLPTL